MANFIIQLSANHDPVGGYVTFVTGLMSAEWTFSFNATSLLYAAEQMFGYGNVLAAGGGTVASPLTLTFQGDLANTPLPFPVIDAAGVLNPYYQLQAAAGGSYTSASTPAVNASEAIATVTLTNGVSGNPPDSATANPSSLMSIDGNSFDPAGNFSASPNWMPTGTYTPFVSWQVQSDYMGPQSIPDFNTAALTMLGGAEAWDGTANAVITTQGLDTVNQVDTLAVTGTTGTFAISTDVGVTANIANDGSAYTITAALIAAGVSYAVSVTLVSTTYGTAGAPPTYTYSIQFENGTSTDGGAPSSTWSGTFSSLSSPITMTATVLQAGSYVAQSSGAQVRGLLTGGRM